MSFRALFSATRMRSNTSFAAMVNPPNNNSSRSSQDVDKESRTNINNTSTTVPQENNFQQSRTNTLNMVSQENRDDRSSSQRLNRDPGVLLQTTITNSGVNQEITTGLSIQSN